MEPLTIRVQANTKESLEGEAAEYDVSVSEYVRTLIDKGREYDELADRLDEREERIAELERQLADRSEPPEEIDELRAELDRLEGVEAERDSLADEVEALQERINSLEARNRDLTNQLAESNRRIDTAAEIVEYVEEERTANERYRRAGLLGKLKYTVFGMDDDGE